MGVMIMGLWDKRENEREWIDLVRTRCGKKKQWPDSEQCW